MLVENCRASDQYRIVLLGEQSDVIAKRREALKQVFGLVAPSRHHKIVH